MSKPEETHVVLIADSISSSVHGANSPLKLGSNIFEHGSAELNLKSSVFTIFHSFRLRKVRTWFGWYQVRGKTFERKKIKSGQMKIWN